jgi:hypothetical protein
MDERAMTWALRIREFFRVLFAPAPHEPCQAEKFLTAALDEMRRERDYFKNRADRLELMMLPSPVLREKMPRTNPGTIIGRKPFEQILEDHNKALAAEEAAKNAPVPKHGNTETPRPDARQSGSN